MDTIPRLMFYPSEILRFRCRPLDSVQTNKLRTLIDDLALVARKHQTPGLAAPQIGVPLPVFVFQYRGVLCAVVNPNLTLHGEPRTEWEGCVSVPGMVGLVPRYPEAELSGLDIRGEPVVWNLSERDARLVQHLQDHLNGILFLDRVAPGTLRAIRMDPGGRDERQL